MTVVGSIYLAAVCVLPTVLIHRFSIPFYFGGTALLIVVGVAIDTISKVQSHLVMRNYEGFMKSAKLKGRSLGGEKEITVKSPAEIEIMRQANRIAASVLQMLEERIVPGTTTMQMDRWAEECCRDHGASPAFRGYRGFPGNLCVSVNEVVVHGIASKEGHSG